MSHSTMSDRRFFDSLRRRKPTWSYAGMSVMPMEDARGMVQTWRACDGVHESYWPTEEQALAAARARMT